MALDNTTAPQSAILTLTDRIKAILFRDHENMVADYIECANQSDDVPVYPASQVSIAEVVRSFVTCGIQSAMGFNNIQMMTEVADEIMRDVAGGEYDPWPELTKEELTFLIGERLGSPHCPYDLYTAVRYDMDSHLAFRQRVIADHHRAWLEKGADAKRKRLAKASVLRLTDDSPCRSDVLFSRHETR